MKHLLLIMMFASMTLFGGSSATAQSEGQTFVIVEYMKVKPGMGASYLACEAVWKKIQEARKEAGLISGWTLEQVMYPSGTDAEYDYLTITAVDGWQGIEDLNMSWTEETWEMVTEGLSDDEIELANRAEEFRDLVKREIWTAVDVVMGENTGWAPYIVENYMQIPEDGWDAWVEMETEFVKPVHEHNIEAGKRAGWLLGYMVMPSGSHMPYQASTLDYYDTWEDLMSDEGAAWSEVYPDMSDEEINERIVGVRVLGKREIRVLVDYIE